MYNRQKMSVTATDLPINPSRRTGPVVAVLGPIGRVAALPAHLPAGWVTRQARDLADIRPGEIVLLSAPSGHDIRTARAALPASASVVALVDDDAAAEQVAAVLTAGADVCVRGGQPAILAGHLVACRRRQLADRWAGLAARAEAVAAA